MRPCQRLASLALIIACLWWLDRFSGGIRTTVRDVHQKQRPSPAIATRQRDALSGDLLRSASEAALDVTAVHPHIHYDERPRVIERPHVHVTGDDATPTGLCASAHNQLHAALRSVGSLPSAVKSVAVIPLTGFAASKATLTRPVCPTSRDLLELDADDRDHNVDQRSSHILFKYNYYAARCNRTGGIMWKHLTLPVMTAVTGRVVGLLLELSRWDNARPLRILDWASGCGTGSYVLSSAVLARTGTAPLITGVELMPAAVDYARRSYLNTSSIVFCRADGSKLSWVPDGSFDWIVSFGGLLHLPTRSMCETVTQLFSKLDTSGARTPVIWTGYVDNPATAAALVECTKQVGSAPQRAKSTTCVGAQSNAEEELEVHSNTSAITAAMLHENVFWRGSGMPKVYRRKKPVSIVWKLDARFIN